MRKILAMALALLVTAGLFYVGGRTLSARYIYWNGTLLPRQAQSVDISGRPLKNPEAFLELPDLRQLDARDTGMTISQYEWFRQALPDCQVLWEVPVQGSFCSLDTQRLTLENPAQTDLEALSYLPALTDLELGSDPSPELLAWLARNAPALALHYRITVGGELWDADAVSLVLRDADPEELAEKLSLFDKLQSVLLTGAVPEQEQLRQLQAQYPDIAFLWKVSILGQELETDTTTLDLPDGAIAAVEELRELLAYFPALEQVRLSTLGLDQEALIALAAEYPQIHFQFDLAFQGRVFSTDAEEIDLSNLPLDSTAAVEAILPCFRRLQKVVMCQCGLSDEAMDSLNQKYPDIRFVWSVNLAGMDFRTDSVHFTPNRWGLECTDENIAGLRYCTDMVCVDIGHAMEVTHCQWAANMPALKYLILAETSVSDISPLEGHENLIYLELFLSQVRDYTPLVSCRALEDLNLCYTYGDPQIIGQMTWLKRLWWGGRWEARVTLPQLLTQTEMDFDSGSSTGRGWRDGQNYLDMRDFIGMEYMTG